MTVLNQDLYDRIKAQFGTVKVRNPGDRFIASCASSPRDRGKIDQWGEGYATKCPYCRREYSLTINHHWAEPHQALPGGTMFLVKCHDHDCLSVASRRDDLFRKLYPRGKKGRSVSPPPPRRPVLMGRNRPEVALPARVNLTALTEDHPVRSALEFHYLDVPPLVTRYDLSACEDCTECKPPLPGPHLLMPITWPIHSMSGPDAGELTEHLSGWVAQPIPLKVRSPVYIPMDGLLLDETLYGLWAMMASEGPVVVVEHPLSVWHLGHNAVALFGDRISHGQARMIAQYRDGRPIVILMRADRAAEAYRIRSKILKACRIPNDDSIEVQIVFLPEGCRQPVECGAEPLRRMVSDAVAESQRTLTRSRRRS